MLARGSGCCARSNDERSDVSKPVQRADERGKWRELHTCSEMGANSVQNRGNRSFVIRLWEPFY